MPLEMVAFQSKILSKLRRRLPELSFRADPYAVNLIYGRYGRNEYPLLLDGGYDMYRQGFDSLDEVVERFANYMSTIVAAHKEGVSLPWHLAKPRLALQLRHALPSDDHDALAVPLNFPGLSMAVVLDLDEYTVPVEPQHLEIWRVDATEIVATARHQTRQRLPQWVPCTIEDRLVWKAEDGRGFASAAIGFDDWLDSLPVALADSWIAAPCRDVALLFEGGLPNEDPFTTKMLDVVNHIQENAAYPFYPVLYRRNAAGIQLLSKLDTLETADVYENPFSVN